MPYDAIVKPVKGKKSPRLGDNALLVSTQSDMNVLRRRLALEDVRPTPLYVSDLYHSNHPALKGMALAGPVIGSPYAVMVLETLICWGAQNIVFWGWCGAVSPAINIGDIIVPTSAVVDEGTSKHYPKGSSSSPYGDKTLVSRPNGVLVDLLISELNTAGLSHGLGSIWTTDALYRETRQKVAHYEKMGVLAVEMELSALFTAARFRNVSLAALLVVSDDLSSHSWQPGFKDDRFIKSCREVAQVMTGLSRRPHWRLPAKPLPEEAADGPH